jgi:hypothetical protein
VRATAPDVIDPLDRTLTGTAGAFPAEAQVYVSVGANLLTILSAPPAAEGRSAPARATRQRRRPAVHCVCCYILLLKKGLTGGAD